MTMHEKRGVAWLVGCLVFVVSFIITSARIPLTADDWTWQWTHSVIPSLVWGFTVSFSLALYFTRGES